MFWAEIWKNISFFLSKNFQFSEVKFSVYLNRRVFEMPSDGSISLHLGQSDQWLLSTWISQTSQSAQQIQIRLCRCTGCGYSPGTHCHKVVFCCSSSTKPIKSSTDSMLSNSSFIYWTCIQCHNFLHLSGRDNFQWVGNSVKITFVPFWKGSTLYGKKMFPVEANSFLIE